MHLKMVKQEHKEFTNEIYCGWDFLFQQQLDNTRSSRGLPANFCHLCLSSGRKPNDKSYSKLGVDFVQSSL